MPLFVQNREAAEELQYVLDIEVQAAIFHFQKYLGESREVEANGGFAEKLAKVK